MTVSFRPKIGNYRVIGVDTYDGTDWVYGDFENYQKAIALANAEGAEMLRTYVYDKDENCIFEGGTF